jgi:hypothetical protein
MAMRSWVLKSWPEVHWQLPTVGKRWPAFQHMGTDLRPDPDANGQMVGDTVWAVRLDARRVLGVAWEWVALRGHLPAVRDPNGFITNGCLFGDQGIALDEASSIVGLNRVAHAVPWQRIVARVLRGEAAELVTPKVAARIYTGRFVPPLTASLNGALVDAYPALRSAPGPRRREALAA